MMHRVLLIDDDPVFARLVKAIGIDYGLEFDTHESLSNLGTVAFLGHYDAALLDFHLPEVNGFEIAEYYQRFFQKIPVIIVSAGTLDPRLSWPPCVNHLLCKSTGVVRIVESVCDIIKKNSCDQLQTAEHKNFLARRPFTRMAEDPNTDPQQSRYFPA